MKRQDLLLAHMKAYAVDRETNALLLKHMGIAGDAKVVKEKLLAIDLATKALLVKWVESVPIPTGEEIVAVLEALTGDDRLRASAIRIIDVADYFTGTDVETALIELATVSTANKTIYVDKAAVGAADGTSWADAFTTIQASIDALPNTIAHDYTIIVREGATPYREEVLITKHLITGTLTIEGEYYWYGDCEANVGGAGEITDAGAFADVAIGDKVFILDLNGGGGRAQDYELCTVDNIANIPNRIGTDGAKIPALNWKYTIVRTEISGSDDGTDPGTARDYCFILTSIDNVTMQGLYYTFSDLYAIQLPSNSRRINIYYSIFDDCDRGIQLARLSHINTENCLFNLSDRHAVHSTGSDIIIARYLAVNIIAVDDAFWGTRSDSFDIRYIYIDTAADGLEMKQNASAYITLSTISANTQIGLKAVTNAVILTSVITNNAIAPVSPIGTVEGAYIV